MRVRAVNRDDIDGLMEQMKEYYDFYDVNPPDDKKITNLIETLIDNEKKGIQFVATVDKKICGFVTLYKLMSTMNCEEIILMNDLYVTPSYRGKGLGKLLFNRAKEYTFKNGFPKMEWMTEPDNKRARNFYDKLGGLSTQWVYYSLSKRDDIDCIY